MAHLAFFNKMHEAVFPHGREEKSRRFLLCRHLAALGAAEGGADTVCVCLKALRCRVSTGRYPVDANFSWLFLGTF